MNDVFPEFGNTAAANAGTGQPKSHKGKWIAGILVALLAVTGFTAWSAVGQYNELQHNDVRVDVCWHNVLNQYTRRANLIPNLVSVVKTYAAHESELFNQLAATRASLAALSASVADGRNPDNSNAFQAAQNKLSAQLTRLLVVAEQYPELKSSALFQDLMAQLEGTENRIAYVRQKYIESVADYNFGIRRFPTSLIAAQAGFKPKATITVDNEAVVLAPLKLDLK
jgi:LemA protein